MLTRHICCVLCLKAQILAYVEYFGQFTSDSEQFPEDVAQVLYLLA
jgi:GIGANTEA protein